VNRLLGFALGDLRASGARHALLTLAFAANVAAAVEKIARFNTNPTQPIDVNRARLVATLLQVEESKVDPTKHRLCSAVSVRGIVFEYLHKMAADRAGSVFHMTVMLTSLKERGLFVDLAAQFIDMQRLIDGYVSIKSVKDTAIPSPNKRQKVTESQAVPS
jgi:hypothetical protein